MVEQTSIESYKKTISEGTLSKNQSIVYDTITKNPYLTDREYCEILGWEDTNKWKPRRTELLGMGLIESAGKRPCNITNRSAYVWQNTNKKYHKGIYLGEWINE